MITQVVLLGTQKWTCQQKLGFQTDLATRSISSLCDMLFLPKMMLFIHQILIYQNIEKEINHAMDGYFYLSTYGTLCRTSCHLSVLEKSKNISPNDTLFPQMPERNKTVNLSLCDLLTSRKWDNDTPRMTVSSVTKWYIGRHPSCYFPKLEKWKMNHATIRYSFKSALWTGR